MGVRDRGFLVVGGTAGIGREVARLLVEEGARVAITGRDAGRAHNVAATIGAVAVPGDAATDQPACEAIVNAAERGVGGLSGVAVTAGSNRSAHSTLEAATDDIWQETFEHQLMATVRIVRAALPCLISNGGGSVVTTAAYSIRAPHTNRVPYATCKSAVATFTKDVAKAYGPARIRANCVCPGIIETDHLAARRVTLAASRGVPEAGLLESMLGTEWHMDVALGRLGLPEEVADLIAFLLSTRAGYLSGALINIDGGTDF
ncbi:MAG TPA: SDR family oxidoreductase [Acidimicrobiales bacterium]|nr:SDR family oxidoreductase [Acidimicrobiales bacterium]